MSKDQKIRDIIELVDSAVLDAKDTQQKVTPLGTIDILDQIRDKLVGTLSKPK